MSRPYKVLDLFSGIGGFSLGLEAAGLETAAFCEISAVCRHLLKHHWPEVPAYDDITTLTGQRLVADGIDVDALCGGFPCQDLSYAGKGAGLSGARSGLWFEIARLLRELRDLGRPVRFVLLENVSALLGRGLGVVLGDLAALGYDAEWDCIPAAAVGAPHRRDRIWIVAYPRGQQHEGYGDAFRRALATELSRAAISNTHGFLHAGELDSGATHDATGGSESGDGSEGQAPHRQRVRAQSSAGCKVVADANSERQKGRRLSMPAKRRQSSDIIRSGSSIRGATIRQGGWWAAEPNVGRVAHGVPARVDRLHGLGNAVVPQIPEILGRALLAAELAA